MVKIIYRVIYISPLWVQNAPTRTSARLGTWRVTRRLTRKLQTVHTPTRRAARHVRRDNRRKYLKLRPKLYLICQNLALYQIWNLYQSGIHKLKMTILYLFLLHFYVIFNYKNDFFGWPWPWIVKYSPPTDSWKSEVLHDSLWLYSQDCEILISRWWPFWRPFWICSTDEVLVWIFWAWDKNRI